MKMSLAFARRGFVATGVTLLVGGLVMASSVSVSRPAEAGGNEIMKDRCSGEVAFPASYDGKVTDEGMLILKRDASESTPWSAPFTVKKGDDGHIRWWCRSKSQWGWLDPGTWRPKKDGNKQKFCLNENIPSTCKELPMGTSAVDGWFPERSRCDNRSSRIRARLGKDRLLQIECLPK